MKIRPIDIANKTFDRKMMGLDPHVVYNFLRDVADQYEEVFREKERLEKQINEQRHTLDDLEDRDHSLRSTIQAAAKMSDHFRQDAEREAQLIVEDARQRANIMVQDARDSLKKIYQEIADLKRTRLQFETNLKSLMEAHMTMLRQGKDVFTDPELPEFIEEPIRPVIREAKTDQEDDLEATV